MMLRLALTGGIGSGKSTAAAAFSELGATIIDADLIARAVVAKDTPGFAAVVAQFGSKIIAPSGELDRAALGAIVFADEAARRALNAIVHPAVREEAARQIAEAQREDPDAVTIEDIPLLAETSGAAQFHAVIVVHTSIPVRMQRLLGRGMSAQDARARMQAQASDAQRAEIADVILRNDGSRADLDAQIRELWENRIQPYQQNLSQGTAPNTETCVPDSGALERAARRLQHHWEPFHGRITASKQDGSTLILTAPQETSQIAQVMRQAGFVAAGAEHFVSADPGAPVLVRLEH